MAFDWKAQEKKKALENQPKDYKFMFVIVLVLMLFGANELRKCSSEDLTDNRIIRLSRKLDEANSKIKHLEERHDLIAISR